MNAMFFYCPNKEAAMGIIVVSLTCTFSFLWQLSLRFMMVLFVFETF